MRLWEKPDANRWAESSRMKQESWALWAPVLLIGRCPESQSGAVNPWTLLRGINEHRANSRQEGRLHHLPSHWELQGWLKSILMNYVWQKMGDINSTSDVASSLIASIKVSDYTLLRDNNGLGHVSEKKVSVKCVRLLQCQNDTSRTKQIPVKSKPNNFDSSDTYCWNWAKQSVHINEQTSAVHGLRRCTAQVRLVKILLNTFCVFNLHFQKIKNTQPGKILEVIICIQPSVCNLVHVWGQLLCCHWLWKRHQ